MKKKSILVFFVALFYFIGQYSYAAEANLTKKLVAGTKNAEVKTLQEILIKRGHLFDIADGSFGPKTLQALRAFQLAEGLQIDGITGPKTRASLLNYASSGASQSDPTLNSVVKNSITTNTSNKENTKCTSSICATIISPNGGETFYTSQKIQVSYRASGFDSSFRSKEIDLVKKTDSGYVVLYNFGGGQDRRTTEEIILPRGLKLGNNYAIKIRVYNASGQEATDYSDNTFTIKPRSVSTCITPSVNIAVAPTFSPSGNFGLLSDYVLSAGGGEDCTVRIKKIQFKSNVNVTKWRTQFTDVETSQKGNILIITMKEPIMTLSGESVNVPDQMGTPTADGRVPVKTYRKQLPTQALNVWGEFTNTTININDVAKNLIDPISIEAVDINGEPITSIIGLKK